MSVSSPEPNSVVVAMMPTCRGVNPSSMRYNGSSRLTNPSPNARSPFATRRRLTSEELFKSNLDLLRAECEIVEQGHAVGFGPYADASGAGDMAVVGFDIG